MKDIKVVDIKTSVNAQGLPLLALRGKKRIYAPVVGPGEKVQKTEKNAEKEG